jgi:hypothetical protein
MVVVEATGFPLQAIAYHPSGPVAASHGSGGWWAIVALGGLVLCSIVGPLMLRRWQHHKLVRTLIQGVHAEVSAALTDPLLVHQARRAVFSWRPESGERPPGG